MSAWHDLAGFRTQFPELPQATASDASVERALVEAKLIHGYRELAILYVAAHLVTTEALLSKGVTPASVITGESAGPLKVTYGGRGFSQDRTAYEQFFMRTEYGRRFLMLEARTPSFAIGARACG